MAKRIAITIFFLFIFVIDIGVKFDLAQHFLTLTDIEMYNIFGDQWLEFDLETRQTMMNIKEGFYR